VTRDSRERAADENTVRQTATDLKDWEVARHAGKVSHHLPSNYRVRIDGASAELYAQGYSWNRAPTLPQGTDLWETWGNYCPTYQRTASGWRLDGFHYYSKLNRGNNTVRTHSA
jgi:hypothetical protein